MMVERVHIGHLKIARKLVDFVNQEVLPDTNLSPEVFWAGSEAIIAEFSPKNRLLLQRRDDLQAKIDQWHRTHSHKHIDITSYKTFLYDIGYLVPESDNEEVRITTTNVDEEIATKAGPQLVVPLMNARFTLNAANARWGSLYDALYGTDAITETDGCEKTAHYNPKRGEQVIAFARKFLDQTIPLANEASHTLASRYMIDSGLLKIQLADGTMTHLKDPNQWLGYQGSPEAPTAILFIHHGLHVEIQIDREQSHNDPAGIRDILIESAITTIVDCEDSVAAVDTDDKIQLYRNWLGLMKGDLAAEFHKGKELIHRKLNPDRIYTSPTGAQLQLPGRSLLFIRHVGHLLYTDAILDRHGEEIPEGILDALVTTLIALQDLNPHHRRTIRNSRQGSIYVVKPKQHGPEEVAFTCQLFSAVEDLLQIPRNTLKIGVMDEERRTSLNLTACIREAKDRLAFINTGFLDRTGDEIHTSMLAGPMLLKAKMKDAKWFLAYEKNNVQVGLKCGLMGKAQIGKGMWAIPDKMAAMLEQKMNHLKAGATCAWVPSPTAATLHALHYHQVDAVVRQNEMMPALISSSADYLDDLLTIPILLERPPAEVIQRELDNNAQSILGYVVRWIDHGIGCSKVPDIDEIGLMEDRATLRISSQHIANWYKHGLVTKAQIEETFQKMAKVVDRQNATSPDYHPMAPNLTENIAFQAALELVLQGDQQPNGYTEPILHRRRREYKARNCHASSS